MSKSFASFKLRLLAYVNDVNVFLIFHVIFWFYMASATNLVQLGYSFLLYLTLVLIPSFLIGALFYNPWLTTNLGGTLGKLLTGLEVVDENNQRLNYKRSFFRYTIGYGFSSIFFFLGFLSVIKDPNKQGWHDKAVGSYVIVKRKMWPVSLLILILLLIGVFYFVSGTINRVKNSPIKNELQTIIISTKQERLKNTTPSATPEIFLEN